jgi:tRNA (guanine-N7-)-methyltransferase
MQAMSKDIESNQSGIHENLDVVVRKHLKTDFQKPYADHSKRAFEEVIRRLDGLKGCPIIFDSCCGVGDSTRALTKKFPSHVVIGADKSEKRLLTERTDTVPDNLIFVRTDLNDFYRMAVDAGWQFDRHYILYPNPWPKSEHLKRRWHGAPVFSSILKLGGRLELRSNWQIYLLEFQAALKIAGIDAEVRQFEADKPMTAFEAKYRSSDQLLWQLVAQIN